MKSAQILPFLWAALFWAVVSTGICWMTGALLTTGKSLFLFEGLSLVDLWAIAKVVFCMLAIAAGTSETSDAGVAAAAPQKRVFLIIQASYWLAIKIVCVLFFGTLLFRGKSLYAHGATGVILGISTLFVVPLVGGIGWYLQKAPKKLPEN